VLHNIAVCGISNTESVIRASVNDLDEASLAALWNMNLKSEEVGLCDLLWWVRNAETPNCRTTEMPNV